MNKTYKANKNNKIIVEGLVVEYEAGVDEWSVCRKNDDGSKVWVATLETDTPKTRPEWYDEVVEKKNCECVLIEGYACSECEESTVSDDEVGYKILWSHDARVLSCNIVDSIQQGWKPLGGVQVIEDDGGYQEFYQSMVRNLPS